MTQFISHEKDSKQMSASSRHSIICITFERTRKDARRRKKGYLKVYLVENYFCEKEIKEDKRVKI